MCNVGLLKTFLSVCMTAYMNCILVLLLLSYVIGRLMFWVFFFSFLFNCPFLYLCPYICQRVQSKVSRFVLCPADRCGHSLQVLDSNEGEVRSSAFNSWSYRFGSMYDCWTIRGQEGQAIVLRYRLPRWSHTSRLLSSCSSCSSVSTPPPPAFHSFQFDARRSGWR